MTYHRPTNLSDALNILAQADARILAGGTDVLPSHKGRDLTGCTVDITGISELGGIDQTKDGWRIGATTTWADIANATLPAAFHALQQAAREVGSLQIQNSATVAGNLCNASPAADGVPPLLVLDAMVEVGSLRGQRQIPLSDFISGVRSTVLKAGEIVTAIRVPHCAAQGTSAFQKLGARKYLVISICMVAVRLELSGDTVNNASISVGACSPVARRLPLLEDALVGCPFDDPAVWLPTLKQQVTKELSPIDDIRADAEYRQTATIELINQTILKAAKRGAQ